MELSLGQIRESTFLNSISPDPRDNEGFPLDTEFPLELVALTPAVSITTTTLNTFSDETKSVLC